MISSHLLDLLLDRWALVYDVFQVADPSPSLSPRPHCQPHLHAQQLYRFGPRHRPNQAPRHRVAVTY